MTTTKTLVALLLGCSAAFATQAASIYLTPTPNQPTLFLIGMTSYVPIGTPSYAFDLMMNFSAAELTVGGGIDIGVSGAGSFASFTPSSYFTTTADPAFSGFGTAHADRDYEVHFGSFSGLSGINKIGTITLALTGIAGTTTSVSLATNQFWGGFYSATTATLQNAGLTGGLVTVVPEPQAALLMLAGLGAVGATLRRRPTTT